MATIVDESLLVKYVYKLYEIIMDGREMTTNLVILDLLEFDVILGMDCLVAYYVTIDCHLNMVKFNTLSE